MASKSDPRCWAANVAGERPRPTGRSSTPFARAGRWHGVHSRPPQASGDQGDAGSCDPNWGQPVSPPPVSIERPPTNPPSRRGLRAPDDSTPSSTATTPPHLRRRAPRLARCPRAALLSEPRARRPAEPRAWPAPARADGPAEAALERPPRRPRPRSPRTPAGPTPGRSAASTSGSTVARSTIRPSRPTREERWPAASLAPSCSAGAQLNRRVLTSGETGSIERCVTPDFQNFSGDPSPRAQVFLELVVRLGRLLRIVDRPLGRSVARQFRNTICPRRGPTGPLSEPGR